MPKSITVSSSNLQNVDFSISKAGIPYGGSMSKPLQSALKIDYPKK